MSYTIRTHRHRFAAWSAGLAASVKGCRFRVEEAEHLLTATGVEKAGADVHNLPAPDRFTSHHRQWRHAIIEIAQERFHHEFTHGVAAKLINVYFKSIFVCGGLHDAPKVKAIHPPVDSVLLEALYLKDVGDSETRGSSLDERGGQSSIATNTKWSFERFKARCRPREACGKSRNIGPGLSNNGSRRSSLKPW